MSLYRIMLVDDEEEVRKAMIRQMDWERLGFTVVGDAENGQEALEKLEQLEPEVIMTDIRMPYMDGLTLTARIREKYPSIKILIFSGYDDFGVCTAGDQAERHGIYLKTSQRRRTGRDFKSNKNQFGPGD